MLNLNKNGLRIFDNFITDPNLPKFKSENFNISEDDEMTTNPSAFFMPNENIRIGNNLDSDDFIYKNGFFYKKKPSIRERLQYLWSGKLKEYKIPVPKPTLTPSDFFKSIKNNAKELRKIEKRTEGYIEALKHAGTMGQTALMEKLKTQIDVVRSETQLYATGFKTIIEESQVVEFYKKSEVGIRLDYIKNFTRVIPSKFLEIKRKLDEKAIFDNYAIMHYDKNKDGYALTNKEKEIAKDPILFGLIKGSRKLYYIGDWEDEYCDLTLENFIDEFGKKAITKNDLKATIKI